MKSGRARAIRGETGAELRAQVEFLENSVRRLTHELSQYQATYGGDTTTAANGGAMRELSGEGRGGGQDSFLEGTAQGDPLPPWLWEPKYLSPLLVAYDERLRDKDRQLVASQELIDSLRADALGLAGESEAMAADVARLTAALASKAEGEQQQQHQHASSDHETALQRVELLTQENDLLLEQQEQLETELMRLRASVKESAGEVSDLHAQLEDAHTRLAVAEERLHDAAKERQGILAECKALRAEKDKLQEESVRARSSGAAAEAMASQARRDMDKLRSRWGVERSALEREVALLQQKKADGAAATRALEHSCEMAQDRAAAAERELAIAKEDVAVLKKSLEAMERSLHDSLQRDSTAFTRISEARATAASAVADKDLLQSRVGQLEEELAGALQRGQAQRAEWRGRMEAEMASRSATLEGLHAAAQARLAGAEAQCTELRSALDRAVRENRTRGDELARIQEKAALLASQAVADISPAGSMSALAARVEEAERARDEAQEKATSLSYAAQRSLQEWERERGALMSHAAALGRRLQKADADLEEAKVEVARLQKEAEELRRTHRLATKGQMQTEAALRREMEDLAMEYQAQVRALQKRLRQSVALHERTAADAEGLFKAKEGLLQQWREEGRAAAAAFEAASSEQRVEIGRLRARVEDLVNRTRLLEARACRAEREGAAALEELQALRPLHEAAERRASEASTQVIVLLEAEEASMRSKKELRAQMDRLAVERERAQRQAAHLASHAEALKGQLAEAEGAVRVSAVTREEEKTLREALRVATLSATRRTFPDDLAMDNTWARTGPTSPSQAPGVEGSAGRLEASVLPPSAVAA